MRRPCICDHPDDDGPRLVFADWLEEQGNPYGEFIRSQIDRFRLPPTDREGRRRLAEREDELQKEHDAAWRGELPGLTGVKWTYYRRGLICAIEVDTARRFLENAQAIFAAAPIQEVWFSGLDSEGAALLASSHYLQKIAVLKNHGTATGDAGMVALVGSANIVNVRRLFFNGNGLTDEAARAIARSRYLERLVTLFLHHNRIGDAGAITLAESRRLPKVEEVYLVANEIHESGTAALKARWGERAFV